nr:hypothetical protein [uncultured Flavobacterium sp.]
MAKKSVERNKERPQFKITAVLTNIGQTIESNNVFVDTNENTKIDSPQLQEKRKDINENTKRES